MRLRSFSTLGCFGVGPAAIAELARRHGLAEVELLRAPGEPLSPDLGAVELDGLRVELAPVRVLVICGYTRLGTAGPDGPVIESLLADAQAAAGLGAVGVRLFPGDEGLGVAVMAGRLRAAAEQAPDGVEFWLETHDSHPRGRDVASVLAAADTQRVGAIWDLAHPYAAGEAPEDTAAALAPWLRQVQIKDEDERRRPVLPGTGVLPLPRLLAAAASVGEESVGLEWERKWHPEIAPLPIALAATTALLARVPGAARSGSSLSL